MKDFGLKELMDENSELRKELKRRHRREKIYQTITGFIGNGIAVVMFVMFVAVLFLLAYKFGIMLTWIN